MCGSIVSLDRSGERQRQQQQLPCRDPSSGIYASLSLSLSLRRAPSPRGRGVGARDAPCRASPCGTTGSTAEPSRPAGPAVEALASEQAGKTAPKNRPQTAAAMTRVSSAETRHTPTAETKTYKRAASFSLPNERENHAASRGTRPRRLRAEVVPENRRIPRACADKCTLDLPRRACFRLVRDETEERTRVF